jgi:hypothetical protein
MPLQTAQSLEFVRTNCTFVLPGFVDLFVDVQLVDVFEGRTANLAFGRSLVRVGDPMFGQRVSIDGLEATLFANECHVLVRTFVGR